MFSSPQFFVSKFAFPAFVQTAWLDRTALVWGEEQLSYRALLDLVETRLADFLKRSLEGKTVTLEIPKSPAYVIDFLALLSVGAVIVPMESSLPEQRKKEMLDKIKPALRVQTNSLLQAAGAPVSPPLSRDGDVPSTLFFTSGSTGIPKAIVGARRGFLHFIHWQGCAFGIGPGDRVSFLTTIGFDVSLRDLFLPLLYGATLVIPNEEDTTTPQATLAWLARMRITHVHTVPSIARLWARTPKEDFLNIRFLFLAGEKLTRPLVSELHHAFPEIGQIVNLYGPTETTLAKFFHCLEETDLQEHDIPVGKPLPGTEFYFAEAGDNDGNAWRHPNESRTSGEVVIVTAYASLGYLDSHSETQERFHTRADGWVAYRTGDLGRLTPEGNLVILGRRDEEVKINGQRIHPLEVEKTLASAPMVRDVAVVTQKSADGTPRLMAFWTKKPECSDQADTAPRAYALSRLPRAFVPTLWSQLEALPMNKNGKIDRKALCSFEGQQNEEQEESPEETPTDFEARWLLKTVAELLSVQTPRLTASFFALGGTSLHVAFLIGRIEKELKKSLDFADVFEAPDLSALVELIRAAPIRRAVTIPPIAKAESYPLSPQQRWWWNIYLPERNRSWATMVKVISLKGRFSAAALRKAVSALVTAQESLQLFFSKKNGEIRQHLYPCDTPDEMPVVMHDLSAETPEDAAKALETLRLTSANREIDPTNWPLFRIQGVLMPGFCEQKRGAFAMSPVLTKNKGNFEGDVGPSCEKFSDVNCQNQPWPEGLQCGSLSAELKSLKKEPPFPPAHSVLQHHDFQHATKASRFLFTEPKEQTTVILAIHHMISDGFSVGLMESALRDLLEQGKPYAPVLPFSYLSYAAWALKEEEQACGPGSEAHAYWHNLFQEPYQKVIFQEQWQGVGQDRGCGYCRPVPETLRRALTETARQEGLTEFSLFLAAKFLAWHETRARDDLVIGTPASGRELPGTENILGNFISLVCVRSRTPHPKNLRMYTRKIMQATAKAMRFQSYHYDTLVRSLGFPFEQDRFPLTTLFISYLNFDSLRTQPLAPSEIGHTDLGFAVKFDVMAYVREHKDATSLQVQYRNNLFHPEEISLFADQWLDALQRIVLS